MKNHLHFILFEEDSFEKSAVTAIERKHILCMLDYHFTRNDAAHHRQPRLPRLPRQPPYPVYPCSAIHQEFACQKQSHGQD
jgi:hypothetical protein